MSRSHHDYSTLSDYDNVDMSDTRAGQGMSAGGGNSTNSYTYAAKPTGRLSHIEAARANGWDGKAPRHRLKGWPRPPGKPSRFSPVPVRPDGWNDDLEAEFQATEPVLSMRSLMPPKEGKAKYWSKVILCVVVVALLIVAWYYHKAAVDYLAKAKSWIQKHGAWSWVIPTVTLVVMCIPPLFGHEVVALLCGLFWGPWIGLAIVGGATFVGEMLVFFAFRHGCRSRAEKHRQSNSLWAGTEYIFTRNGGMFWWLGGTAGIVSFWTRLSLLPGHITTVLLSLVNMNWFVYMWVTLVTQIKQLAAIYAGVLYGQAGGSSTDKKITAAVWAVEILISIVCCVYFYIKLNQNEAIVWYEHHGGKLSASQPLYAGRPTFDGENEYKATVDSQNAFEMTNQNVLTAMSSHDHHTHHTAPAASGYSSYSPAQLEQPSQGAIGQYPPQAQYQQYSQPAYEYSQPPTGYPQQGYQQGYQHQQQQATFPEARPYGQY